MNKRAITEHGILTIIFAIIVVIGISVTGPVISRVFLGPGGEERAASVALQSFQQGVLELLVGAEHRDKQFAAIKMPLFVQDNSYIIVAFNAGDDSVESGCYDESASRPVNVCPNEKSCLCLYEDIATEGDGQDFDDAGLVFGGPGVPKECLQLPGEVVFLAPSKENERDYADEDRGWNIGKVDGADSVKKINRNNPMSRYLIPYRVEYVYENLLLYGECGDMSWNAQQVYIEKFVDQQAKPSITYIYAARIPGPDEPSPARFRESIFRRSLGIDVESIRQKLREGNLISAISQAHALWDDLRVASPDSPALFQAEMLAGEAWEEVAKIAENNPEDAFNTAHRASPSIIYTNFMGVIFGMAPDGERIRWLSGQELVDAALPYVRKAALKTAFDRYMSVVRAYPKKTVVELPEIPQAVLKAYLIAKLQGYKDAESLKKILDELKVQNIPGFDLALLQLERQRLLGARPVRDSQGLYKFFDWRPLLEQVEQYRSELRQFAGRAGSEQRKEALYLLAESYAAYPELSKLEELKSKNVEIIEANAIEEALKIAIQILQEYPSDYKAAGFSPDAKELLWKHCITAENQELIASCGAVVDLPPVLPADMSTLAARQDYFTAVKQFSESREGEGYFGVSIDSYNEFLKLYHSQQGSAFTAPEDSEILVRVYLALARLNLKQNQPAGAQVWLASFAPVQLAKLTPGAVRDELQASYNLLLGAAQSCMALHSQPPGYTNNRCVLPEVA